MKATAAEPADQYQDALGLICRWFDARSMQPFDFQRKAWDAYLAGQSGLIHAPTGIGKTYAAWFGPLIEWLTDHHRKQPLGGINNRCARDESPRIRVLWVTPLRALSADIHDALLRTVVDLDLPWSVECRTGDTPASVRNRQKNASPPP
jgi:ATP-dependent helicase Lhr and Lhr-like helicase